VGRFASQVAWLGAELGPEPAQDLLPTRATGLAWMAVEQGGTHDVDAAVVATIGVLHRLIARTPRPWCGPVLDTTLAGLDPTWAPVQAVRLAAAIAAGLHAGHLPAGHPWAVHVEDPVGAAGRALAPVLELVAGLLDGWDPTLAPPAVVTNVGSVRRAGSGYRHTDERLVSVPDLWVELEPWARAEDPLPRTHDAPSVVVRPAPVDAAEPGLPPVPDLPPNAGPVLAAASRWCLPVHEHGGAEWQARIASLFSSSWPPTTGGAQAAVARWWPREVADLMLGSRPEEPAAWCARALVEAERSEGSRARHRRLVEAAARTRRAAPVLSRHAANLRQTDRRLWAVDVWAGAGHALDTRLAADVMRAPEASHPVELALALASRLETAAAGAGPESPLLRAAARTGVSGQTAG